MTLVSATFQVIRFENILTGNTLDNIAHYHKADFVFSLDIYDFIQPQDSDNEWLGVPLEVFVVRLDSLPQNSKLSAVDSFNDQSFVEVEEKELATTASVCWHIFDDIGLVFYWKKLIVKIEDKLFLL